MEAGLFHQNAATFGQRGIAHFFDPVHGGKLGVEIALKIALHVLGRVVLGQVKTGER